MLRRTVQDLEIELDVHRSLKSTQEVALHDIETGYISHLENIQRIVFRLENELTKVRSEADKLTSDSRLLYYLKDLLEMEIRTYGLLMDEEENRLEDVISESSRGTPPNHRQMFLCLISESKFSITKDLLLGELATRRSKHRLNETRENN
ncbi:keratin, type I cytoskeletal 18-like isoform X1 [Hyperolius riggenbachi]|uniref:keratin, type I cytoskeletal 18-like isoform X1 n=1 Tax=Hyperolius riggenbachi TaxID=752182 RepID=UPI0035A2E33F